MKYWYEYGSLLLQLEPVSIHYCNITAFQQKKNTNYRLGLQQQIDKIDY